VGGEGISERGIFKEKLGEKPRRRGGVSVGAEKGGVEKKKKRRPRKGPRQLLALKQMGGNFGMERATKSFCRVKNRRCFYGAKSQVAKAHHQRTETTPRGESGEHAMDASHGLKGAICHGCPSNEF
jgi:hypothetical protein